MRKSLIFFILIPLQTFGEAPECPMYPTKKECLRSVENNYNNFLDFINETANKDEEDELIQASLDVKKYESLACQRTCLE